MQIPIRYLPDSMTVRDMDGSADHEGEYLPPREVGRVRFEPAESLAATSYSLADGARGRVYVDAVNSTGAGPVAVGSKVDVAGREGMRALSCAEMRSASGAVHHWEVDVG